MRALLIGGTGTISTAVSNRLCDIGWDLYVLNRGNKNDVLPDVVKQIRVDINKEEDVAKAIEHLEFDVVVDFIAYTKNQLERDYRLFKGKTKQFIFISSASVYHKPPRDYLITEGTTIANPYWKYSQNKIECEEYLMTLYRDQLFPVTIVRPSHTYDERRIPVGVHGDKGSWQVVRRMLEGKPVIIHGDGTSLWTLTNSKDFAKAFTGLMGNSHAIGEIYHITSDEVLTWNQIHEIVASALGVNLKAVHVSSELLCAIEKYDFTGELIGDKANCAVFDNSKIKLMVPDYVATIRFDQGIKDTIDYIYTHKELQIEDEEFDLWCDQIIEQLDLLKERFRF